MSFFQVFQELWEPWALQYAAVNKGNGELAILLNVKQNEAIKAAEVYSELKYASEEGQAERRMALETHIMEMREIQERQKLLQEQLKQ